MLVVKSGLGHFNPEFQITFGPVKYMTPNDTQQQFSLESDIGYILKGKHIAVSTQRYSPVLFFKC